MRKLIIYSLLITTTYSYSQELNLPVFTQYLADNNFVVSPTFAGIGDNFKIRANGLTQWVGIKGAPDNQSLYTDIRIGEKIRVADINIEGLKFLDPASAVVAAVQMSRGAKDEEEEEEIATEETATEETAAE